MSSLFSLSVQVPLTPKSLSKRLPQNVSFSFQQAREKTLEIKNHQGSASQNHSERPPPPMRRPLIQTRRRENSKCRTLTARSGLDPEGWRQSHPPQTCPHLETRRAGGVGGVPEGPKPQASRRRFPWRAVKVPGLRLGGGGGRVTVWPLPGPALRTETEGTLSDRGSRRWARLLCHKEGQDPACCM